MLSILRTENVSNEKAGPLGYIERPWLVVPPCEETVFCEKTDTVSGEEGIVYAALGLHATW